MNPWRKYHPFLRFPRFTLGILLVATLPLIQFWREFGISSETEVLLEGDQRNLESYRKVREILKKDVIVLVSMESADIFSPQSIDAMDRLGEAFLKLPRSSGVVDVKSLTHSVKPIRRGFSFGFEPLVPDRSPQTLARVRAFCLSHPLVKNLLVAPDGKHATITITYQRDLSTPKLQKDFRRETESILNTFRKEGYRFEVISFPFIEDEIRETLWNDILVFLPSAGVLLLVILWITFRSWRILGLILFSQALLVVSIPGIVHLAGFRLNVFSAMLFPLLTGMHLTLLIHLFSSFQRAQAHHRSTAEALSETLADVCKACFFSTASSVVGLLSLSTCDVAPVRDFGQLGALGMAFVFFLTFGPDVALIRLLFRSGSPEKVQTQGWLSDRHLESYSRWMTGWIERFPGTQVIATAVVFLAVTWGVSRIRTDIRAVEFLNSKSPTRRAAETLDRIYGGINFVQLEFDSGLPGGANRLPFLRYVESIHRFAESQKGVSAVYSYPQFLAMMNQIWEEEKPGSYRLPPSELVISLFVTALKAQNFPFTDALADSSFRTAYLDLRTRDMPADDYLAVLHRVQEFAEREKPKGVRVSAALGIHSILEADRRIIRGQTSSGSTTAIIIGIALALAWRSVVLSTVSLLTNVFPVLFILGLSGWIGLPLNSVTLMLGAIVLGIAMDDSVHFITHWKDLCAQGRTASAALQETLRVKSVPIISTSLILIGIFSLFLLSSFPPILHFGLLAAIAFICAQITVLTFLPAALTLWSRGSRLPLPFRKRDKQI